MLIRSFKSWAVVFVFAVLVCPSAAQDPSKYLTARDSYDLEFVSDPQNSPDGNKIVYVRYFSDIMTDKRHSNLWIINFDGSGHRPLTSGNSSDFSPRWSPDGKHIAFGSLVLSAPKTWAWMPSPPAGAQWAATAKVIDRVTYRFDGAGDLSGFPQIFLVQAEGGTSRQLTKGEFYLPEEFGGGDIVWSPDGKCLIFSANRKENWELESLDSEVYELSLADGFLKALTARWRSIGIDARVKYSSVKVSPSRMRLIWAA